jgi:hypothetical protein
VAALIAVCAAAFPAAARCISFGGKECLPNHPLAREFFEVVKASYACLDTSHVNADGTVETNGKAPPDQVPAFVSAHGDEAVGLYESVAGSCLSTTLGHQALHALSSLQSDPAREALERLWRETRSYDRMIVVRAMLEDPAFRGEDRFDLLWKNELDPRVRHEIARVLRTRRDPKMLAAIDRWTQSETDPETLGALRMAHELIESPGRCVLTGSTWSLRLGSQCEYSCTGDYESHRSDNWIGWQMFSCDERKPAADLLRLYSQDTLRVEFLLPFVRAAMVLAALLLVLVPLAVRFRR